MVNYLFLGNLYDLYLEYLMDVFMGGHTFCPLQPLSDNFETGTLVHRYNLEMISFNLVPKNLVLMKVTRNLFLSTF